MSELLFKASFMVLSALLCFLGYEEYCIIKDKPCIVSKLSKKYRKPAIKKVRRLIDKDIDNL